MSAVLDWVSRRDAVPIDTVSGEVVVPAFSYTGLTWKGASEIVAQYGYSASKNFVVPRSPRKPTSANYVLCIRYRVGNLVTRFAFWTDDNAVMPNIPLYDGEVIPKNFVLEVWNLSGQTEVSNDDDTTIPLSIQRIVTDFTVTPSNYAESDPTIIPVSSISASLSVAPALPTVALSFDHDGNAVVTNPVSSWPDSSGNGRTLSQAVVANQPSVSQVNPGAGNFFCVTFDGVNDFMTGPLIAQDTTLYFVMKQNVWLALSTLFSFIASNIRRIRQYDVSPRLSYISGAGTTVVFSTDDLPVNEWAIVTIQLSTAGPNSIQIGEFTAASGATGQLSKLAIGGEHGGLNFAMMQVLRILGYNAVHTAAQQLAVRQYLAATYFGGGPLPLVFGDNNQWLDNPGFPAPVPNATLPPPAVTPDATPPATNSGNVFGDPGTGEVFGDPATGEVFGEPT